MKREIRKVEGLKPKRKLSDVELRQIEARENPVLNAETPSKDADKERQPTAAELRQRERMLREVSTSPRITPKFKRLR